MASWCFFFKLIIMASWLDVGLLAVFPQLVDFIFSLLVQLNLGKSSATSFIEAISKLLELLSKVAPLLLSLGPSLPLSLKLLLHILNTSLMFLDGLHELSNNGLLILKLGRQLSDVLLLPANGVLKLPLGSFQVIDSFLAHPQFALNLPLCLLNISPLALLRAGR